MNHTTRGVVCRIYAIKSCTRNYIYVEQTNNLEERLKRHKRDYEKPTRYYRPYVLIYSGKCNSRPEARIREKYWKSGSGKAKLRRMAELADLPA